MVVVLCVYTSVGQAERFRHVCGGQSVPHPTIWRELAGQSVPRLLRSLQSTENQLHFLYQQMVTFTNLVFYADKFYQFF